MEAQPVWVNSDERNCAPVEVQVMYPELTDERAVAIAKSVCDNCVFIDPCREYAMATHEQGVWGQTTERDRRSIQRERTKFHKQHRNGIA